MCEYLEGLPGNVVHVVFDNYYYEDDYVAPSKGRQEKGKSRQINHLSQILPRLKDWNDFLSVDEHKRQLINLIADHFLCSLRKEAFITKGDHCYRIFGIIDSDKTEQFNVVEVPELFSLQKEADGRIALHAEYESVHSVGDVCVIADDTDILILLLYIYGKCSAYQLYGMELYQQMKG